MKYSFDVILKDLHYDDPTKISESTMWEMWEGLLDIGRAPQRQRILYLLPRATSTHVAEARDKIRSVRLPDPELVLLADARVSDAAIEALRQAFPSATVSTIASRLRRSILRDSKPQTIEAPEYYVRPTVTVPGADFEPYTGIKVLFSRLRGEAGSFPNPKSRVGVLVAPAGTGKTALARQLASGLHSSAKEGTEPLPLLVERGAWPKEIHEVVSDLSEVFGNAIFAQYQYRPHTDRFERNLHYGAMCIIFDGIDELCSTLPETFKVENIVKDLIDTLSELEGPRIILTCRESFWFDAVPPATQNAVSVLQLQPFDDTQREMFLEKRFPDETEKPKRDQTRTLLNRLHGEKAEDKGSEKSSKMGYLPWVVHLAAKACDEGRRSAAYEASDYVPSPTHDPLGDILLEFCNREVVRARNPLTPVQQVSLLTELAAESGDHFWKTDIDTYFELMLDRIHFQGRRPSSTTMRDHGLLILFNNEKASFQYPEVQDYLRAQAVLRALLDSSSVRTENVLGLCGSQPGRLLDFISQAVRSRFDLDEFVARIRDLRSKFDDPAIRSGLLHIFIRVVRDFGATGSQLTEEICAYLGDRSGRVIGKSQWSGVFTNLDFCDVRFEACVFAEAEFDRCKFNDLTSFNDCQFKKSVRLNENNIGLGSVQVDDYCVFEEGARDAFRRHAHKKVSPALTRHDILKVIREILHFFAVGQLGFKSRKEIDVVRVARNKASFGPEVLQFLIAKDVLMQFQSGTLPMMKVADTKAAYDFLNQSQLGRSVAAAADAVARKLDARE